MHVTSDTARRAARTFMQSAVAYIIVNAPQLDFSQSGTALRTALTGLCVSALAAGLAALMNLERNTVV